MPELTVYDKAKYHHETIEGYGLPEEHAYNHTTFFIRWLIEKDLLGGVIASDFADEVEQCKSGEITVNRLYEIMDCCFVSDMLSDEGNAFAKDYFDFDNGAYIGDYGNVFIKFESEFHVPFTDENYAKIQAQIDKRYAAWRSRRK